MTTTLRSRLSTEADGSDRLQIEFGSFSDDQMIDADELARSMNVCVRTIQRWVNHRQLPQPIRMGRRKIWEVGAIRRFIRNRQEEVERQAKRDAKRIESYGN